MGYKVEAFDIWQYLCGKIYVPLIRCRIDFEGRIDVDVLKTAITMSLKTIPMLGCSFDGQSRKPCWVNRNFTGEDIVNVIEAGEDEERQILRCFSTEIDFGLEPQLKIFIVKGFDGDTFCAIISHIVCDTAGFKQYLYHLSECYTKLKNREELPEWIFHQRGTKPLLANISLQEKIQILRSHFTVYDSVNKKEPGIGTNTDNATVYEAYMVKITLSREKLAILKNFAKDINATINDGLMALFARALCKNTNGENVMFPSTMDLRRFIPPSVNYGISNYSTNCMCYISVESHDTLAETVMQVSEQMQAHKSGKDVLKSVLLWNLAIRFIPYPWLKKYYTRIITFPKISFTNLGIVDTERLNFNNLPIKEAYLTASIKPQPYIQLAASTYNDHCTLSCNICGSQEDKMFVDQLLDDIYAEISMLGSI